MRSRIVLGFALLATVFAGGARAITGGEPDNGAHPYVGLVVFYKQDVMVRRCTGTLIAPAVLLTAAHCSGADEHGVAPDHAQVWFDGGPIPADDRYVEDFQTNGGKHVDCFAGEGGAPLYSGYPCAGGTRGVPHAHPAWTGSLDDVHDIGVVVLGSAPAVAGLGVLPALGYLDGLVGLGPKPDLEYVGYGLQGVKPVFSDVRERRRATGKLIAIGNALTAGLFVQHSASPGRGGGACFGDSGGPVFHDGKVVAVFSFVQNLNCRGVGFSFRTDTQLALDFLSAYVAVPTVAAAPAAPAPLPAASGALAPAGGGAGAAGVPLVDDETATSPSHGNGKGAGSGNGKKTGQ